MWKTSLPFAQKIGSKAPDTSYAKIDEILTTSCCVFAIYCG